MNEGPSIIPGTWHSVREPGTGDTAHVLADERDVILILSGGTVQVRSLPGSASRLEMDIDLSRRPGIGGSWAQRDDPDSPVLIGSALFILAKDGQSMTGKCMGGDPSLPHVNTGTWTLTYSGPMSAGVPGATEAVAPLPGKLRPVDGWDGGSGHPMPI